MGLMFETDIKEPRQPSFHLEVRTVKRWAAPVAAYRDGVEVHGLRKLKYVLWYGLVGGFVLSIVFLFVAAALALDWLFGAMGACIASLLVRLGWRPRPPSSRRRPRARR